MIGKNMNNNKAPIEEDNDYEARFNLLNFFDVLYKVDLRLANKEKNMKTSGLTKVNTS